jgi:hypothetical protein
MLNGFSQDDLSLVEDTNHLQTIFHTDPTNSTNKSKQGNSLLSNSDLDFNRK